MEIDDISAAELKPGDFLLLVQQSDRTYIACVRSDRDQIVTQAQTWLTGDHRRTVFIASVEEMGRYKKQQVWTSTSEESRV